MLGPRQGAVKPVSRRKAAASPCRDGKIVAATAPADLPAFVRRGRLATDSRRAVPTVTLAVLILVLALAAALLAVAVRRRAGRHQRAVSQVLDSADALEARLRTARAEIEAVAGDREDPVRDAMREMLRQRLWLQEHAGGASVGELDSVRASIDAARERIEHQLTLIERARAPLH
jgi:hypothetical protein